MIEIFEELHKHEMLIAAILIIAGLVFSVLVKKIKLPKVTGYILAGIILGKPVLGLINEHDIEKFSSINLLALGFMSITIGAHLDFHKLKSSWKRIISVSFFEIPMTLTFVFGAIYFYSKNLELAMFIAILATSTSPAAVVAVIKETLAKGSFTNTVMPVVALNNIFAITAFGIAASIISYHQIIVGDIAFSIFKSIAISIAIGFVVGYLLKYFSEKHISSDRYILTIMLLAVSITVGISEMLDVNVMLPNMAVGIFIINTSSHRKKILTIFEEIEYIIVIIFFTLAGAHMDFSNIDKVGIIALLYVAFRMIGKLSGAYIGAHIGKLPQRISNNIGFTLIPQAGVVIGLITMAKSDMLLSQKLDISFISTFVLATVAINEIIGPMMTKYAVGKSGEVGRNRPKLIEFIQEEFIKPELESTTKNDAIKELTDFFISSHKETKELGEMIYNSTIARENEGSTGIGHGIAIPHAVVDDGPIIWGAIGMSKKGIEFESLDGELVHIIILIVTPKNHKADMHLAVLSEISKLLSKKEIRQKLFGASQAWQICEILMEQENKDFNYFLSERK